MDADVIVVGAGLAGLVATAELADAGKRVILLDQEGEQNIGGQAFWSFGGMFFVDSPEQRRMGIRDSLDLAMQDWLGSGRDVALLVGGPDGLSAGCLTLADLKWSLSALTYPHPLVRVILSEQLYRAWTINAGHPYHRS